MKKVKRIMSFFQTIVTHIHAFYITYLAHKL